MNNNLVQLSSAELAQADRFQQQISQKEFEIKLVDINSVHLLSQDAGSYFYNQQRMALSKGAITEVSYKDDSFAWTRATLNDVQKNKDDEDNSQHKQHTCDVVAIQFLNPLVDGRAGRLYAGIVLSVVGSHYRL